MGDIKRPFNQQKRERAMSNIFRNRAIDKIRFMQNLTAGMQLIYKGCNFTNEDNGDVVTIKNAWQENDRTALTFVGKKTIWSFEDYVDFAEIFSVYGRGEAPQTDEIGVKVESPYTIYRSSLGTYKDLPAGCFKPQDVKIMQAAYDEQRETQRVKDNLTTATIDGLRQELKAIKDNYLKLQESKAQEFADEFQRAGVHAVLICDHMTMENKEGQLDRLRSVVSRRGETMADYELACVTNELFNLKKQFNNLLSVYEKGVGEKIEISYKYARLTDECINLKLHADAVQSLDIHLQDQRDLANTMNELHDAKKTIKMQEDLLKLKQQLIIKYKVKLDNIKAAANA